MNSQAFMTKFMIVQTKTHAKSMETWSFLFKKNADHSLILDVRIYPHDLKKPYLVREILMTYLHASYGVGHYKVMKMYALY